jgi:hypothetical protein
VIDGKGGAVFESKLGGLCKGQFRWSDGQNTRSCSSPTECTSRKSHGGLPVSTCRLQTG